MHYFMTCQGLPVSVDVQYCEDAKYEGLATTLLIEDVIKAHSPLLKRHHVDAARLHASIIYPGAPVPKKLRKEYKCISDETHRNFLEWIALPTVTSPIEASKENIRGGKLMELLQSKARLIKMYLAQAATKNIKKPYCQSKLYDLLGINALTVKSMRTCVCEICKHCGKYII